jgi:hypothetical protein
LNFILTVIASAGVSTAFAGFLVWLTKAWIGERLKNAIRAEYETKLESHKAQLKAVYETQIETHKAQLKSQSDVELEKLKASLSVAASEHDATFQRLHERRVEVIAKTYAGLRKLHGCVLEYVKVVEMAGEPPRDERRRKTVDAFNEFNPYFTQQQIFLPKRIAQLIQKANDELLQMTNRFTFMVDIPKNNPNVDEWIRITEKLDKEFTQALAGLEGELRRALGDKSDPE